MQHSFIHFNKYFPLDNQVFVTHFAFTAQSFAFQFNYPFTSTSTSTWYFSSQWALLNYITCSFYLCGIPIVRFLCHSRCLCLLSQGYNKSVMLDLAPQLFVHATLDRIHWEILRPSLGFIMALAEGKLRILIGYLTTGAPERYKTAASDSYCNMTTRQN